MLRDYVLILANTGIRVGEARTLKWRDIREVGGAWLCQWRGGCEVRTFWQLSPSCSSHVDPRRPGDNGSDWNLLWRGAPEELQPRIDWLSQKVSRGVAEGGLIVAGGDTALLLELSEHALDTVAVTVAAIVGMLGHLAV